ncbi:MAG: metalloregulator ArsR/SmtB family transcription factor [Kofleriaceae bacterium]|nr:metalloregulator ArsR/SmtB family transcription factor [Kofleriaceae bacterium]
MSPTRGEPSAHDHEHPPRSAPRPPAQIAIVRAAAIFRALGDAARLRLLHTLGRGEWCVSELAAHEGTKLSTLSQQLRLLYAERMVARRREGKHVYYRLADDHVRDLVETALTHAAEKP